MQELAFERVNKHRALAELVVYNRNWLPWWLTTSIVGDFCEQAERYLRGEGLPPLPVRLWWAYKHWRFKKGVQKTSRSYLRDHHKKPVNPMAQSNITGEFFKAGGIIPVAPGQRVEFIPTDNGQQIEVTDIQTGERKVINVSNRMLRSMCRPFDGHDLSGHVADLAKIGILNTPEGEFQVDVTQVRSAIRQSVTGVMNFNGLPIAPSAPRPNSLGDYPRPNCPKCHTPNPELGTPLDPKSPSGWGDSYFTCSNSKCHHTWKWKKVFPGLEENKNKEGTVTGAKLKGTDIPFHLFGQVGATVEQLNEGVKKFARVACLDKLTPEQRLQIARIQAGDDKACKEANHPLAKVTDATRGPHHKNGPRLFP